MATSDAEAATAARRQPGALSGASRVSGDSVRT